MRKGETKATHVEIIGQEDLAAFLDLRAMRREYDRKRCEFLKLMEDGVSVEAGALALRLKKVPRQLINPKSLEPLLGKDGVDELIVRVAPTMFRYLIVDGANGRREGGRDNCRAFLPL